MTNVTGATSQSPEHSHDLTEVEAVLASLAPTNTKFLAALAMLLARVARVDFNASDGEQKTNGRCFGEALPLNFRAGRRYS
jgi:hypothetical protein